MKTVANLTILHTLFIEAHHTADYQTTTGIRNLLNNGANKDDIVAFMMERHLPLDDIGTNQLAEKIMRCPPQIGYLTISNALQWRLQYTRVIDIAGSEQGIYRL